jgi:transketolase
MRKSLCDALVARSVKKDMIFMTGDLGFMALESLQVAMGSRFINAGIAEQNMMSVAAALARQELEVWVYSIAPFLYARAFEQIRNDVAFHNLPVKLIGNGGGYGYGVMGPTHHAIEDYGALLTIPHMIVYAPIFDEDIDAVISRAGESNQPTYIRLGLGESPREFTVPTYAPWRHLTHGNGPVVVALGTLAGSYIEAFNSLQSKDRPNLWAITELPIEQSPMPEKLVAQISISSELCVAEEHIRHSGFGSDLLLHLASRGVYLRRFHHLYAKAHHFERYGSQKYLRRESGLDVDSMLAIVKEMN